MRSLFQIAILTLCLTYSVGLVAAPVERAPFTLQQVHPATATNVGNEIKKRAEEDRNQGKDSLTAKLPALHKEPPDRIFEFGLSMGPPIMAGLEIGFQLFRHWQFGVAYGLVPAGVLPNRNLPQQQQLMADGNFYAIDPIAATRCDMIHPFIRFFPTRRMTYLQFSWLFLRSFHVINSGFTDINTGVVFPGASVTANVTITQNFPTISLGHFFWKSAYFLNVSLGATFIANASSSVTMDTQLPLGMGGAAANQAQTDALQAQVDQGINAFVSAARDFLPFYPSLMITTGLMF